MATEAAVKTGGVEAQIPRNSLALLMIALVVVVLPQAAQLSLWIIAVCLVCCAWRTLVFQGRWDFPSRWIKVSLVAFGFAGVAVSGTSALSLEAFVSLLVLATAFKLVEMKSRRDAYVVMFLCYFVIATQFLFDQSLLLAAYELVAVVVVTAAMVGMNQLQWRVRPLASMRLAGGLVLQALPLTLVLFMFFPRVMPLWSVPVPGTTSMGLSQVIEPGDLTELAQSDAVAFRVQFADGPPAYYQQLYWRGVVYSDLKGGKWRAGTELQVPTEWRQGDGPTLEYEVLLEPTGQNWLYGLNVPASHDPRARLTPDFRLTTEDPVLSVYRYQMRSALDARVGTTLSAEERKRETALPANEDNPRVRDWAQRQFARLGGDAEALAEYMLEHIRSEAYHYTLKPDALPRQGTLDAFWFDTRNGFCAHYASAFVLAMRHAGVPARLVGGYLGGERNPFSDHVVLRQYDAHAWAEIWLDDRGWVRFDPTAAVAPERVIDGVAAALSSEDRLQLGSFASGGSGLIGRLIHMMDSVEHNWNLFVVGFDGSVQSRVLQRWLGELSPTKIGITMLVLGAICLAFVATLLFLRARPQAKHPVARAFEKFAGQARRLGWPIQAEESPSAFIRRVGAGVKSDAHNVDALAQQLEQLLYNPEAELDKSKLRSLAREFGKLRLRMALGAR